MHRLLRCVRFLSIREVPFFSIHIGANDTKSITRFNTCRDLDTSTKSIPHRYFHFILDSEFESDWGGSKGPLDHLNKFIPPSKSWAFGSRRDIDVVRP